LASAYLPAPLSQGPTCTTRLAFSSTRCEATLAGEPHEHNTFATHFHRNMQADCLTFKMYYISLLHAWKHIR
jgi:hypothetical protein